MYWLLSVFDKEKRLVMNTYNEVRKALEREVELSGLLKQETTLQRAKTDGS